MDSIMGTNVEPRTAAEYEAEFDRMLVEIKRINAQMQENRTQINQYNVEIERLKRETREILTRMGAKF